MALLEVVGQIVGKNPRDAPLPDIPEETRRHGLLKKLFVAWLETFLTVRHVLAWPPLIKVGEAFVMPVGPKYVVKVLVHQSEDSAEVCQKELNLARSMSSFLVDGLPVTPGWVNSTFFTNCFALHCTVAFLLLERGTPVPRGAWTCERVGRLVSMLYELMMCGVAPNDVKPPNCVLLTNSSATTSFLALVDWDEHQQEDPRDASAWISKMSILFNHYKSYFGYLKSRHPESAFHPGRFNECIEAMDVFICDPQDSPGPSLYLVGEALISLLVPQQGDARLARRAHVFRTCFKCSSEMLFMGLQIALFQAFVPYTGPWCSETLEKFCERHFERMPLPQATPDSVDEGAPPEGADEKALVTTVQRRLKRPASCSPPPSTKRHCPEAAMGHTLFHAPEVGKTNVI